ncbi:MULTISPECIES: hypothetical protein [Chelativorans]|jgi:hypothetical protein|uniref:Uncharacterized protein n=1 Tax=Chelativorans sp. (strain BNC1) TaxID=266779 RepID=Q11K58_CHESB|nr:MULTISPECIES: hypothetical protein [Chelativorans]
MDAFKDRLSIKAKDTTRAELAHRSLGRERSEAERALTSAMIDIIATAQAGFAQTAAELFRRRIVAPISHRTGWDEALLAQELSTHGELDRAYAENGYGA